LTSSISTNVLLTFELPSHPIRFQHAAPITTGSRSYKNLPL